MISDLIQKTEVPVRNALNDAHISPATAWKSPARRRFYEGSGSPEKGAGDDRERTIPQYQPGRMCGKGSRDPWK